MSVKLLTEHLFEVPSLKGGCTGLSKSTLIKLSNYWKSHATAQLYMSIQLKQIYSGQVINLALIAPFLILSPDPAKLDVNDLPAHITTTDTSVSLDFIPSTCTSPNRKLRPSYIEVSAVLSQRLKS